MHHRSKLYQVQPHLAEACDGVGNGNGNGNMSARGNPHTRHQANASEIPDRRDMTENMRNGARRVNS